MQKRKDLRKQHIKDLPAVIAAQEKLAEEEEAKLSAELTKIKEVMEYKEKKRE